MKQDNRKHPRIARPLEARFIGSSGGSPCRVADISWGGCFVQCLAEARVGERTVVTPTINGGAVDLPAVVVYRVHGIGFGVQFDPMSQEQVDALHGLLGEPPPGVGPKKG